MKHETDVNKIIIAGAWYRLLKDIAHSAEIEISDELDLSIHEATLLYKAIDKIDQLETKIGFEKIAEPYFDYKSKRFSCLFYGSVDTPVRSDIDINVLDICQDILNTYLRNIHTIYTSNYEQLLKRNEEEREQILHDTLTTFRNELESDLKKQTEELEAHVKEGAE